MEIIRKTALLQARADSVRAEGRRIALVPTMGALHPGHLSLIAEGLARADEVWVSIFVNPTQFNDPEDFEGYPRTFESDVEKVRAAGATVVFAPTPDQLYPEGAETWVEVGSLSEPLCGASRPGHFRGVTTVVSKLFLAAKPHVAVFGEKDFQQLAVIRRMARDLGFDIEIVGGATLREDDGVAMSSRNLRLGPAARSQATVLIRAIHGAERAVAAGERSAQALLEDVRKTIEEAPQASLDYAELRDPDSLAEAPPQLDGPTLLALAVHFSPDPDGQGADVRLIDNRVLLPQASPRTSTE
ncbi:MAG: pantoate--beta-alanine ligase [Myxococcota bacterium]|jgi:pantoate--beta-alanine ligase|nr:pantoate--beta-alanine ligase [Myxococcota bacterium]